MRQRLGGWRLELILASRQPRRQRRLRQRLEAAHGGMVVLALRDALQCVVHGAQPVLELGFSLPRG